VLERCKQANKPVLTTGNSTCFLAEFADTLHTSRHLTQCAAIHGDISQGQRTAAVEAFKAGTTPLLIATDVAARGLDIPDVEVSGVTWSPTLPTSDHASPVFVGDEQVPPVASATLRDHGIEITCPLNLPARMVFTCLFPPVDVMPPP
jgi:hypothetical protein